MKLLLNYLPYSMKDSDVPVRSPKKASAKKPCNGASGNTKITKFFSSFYSSNTDNNNVGDNNDADADNNIKKRAPKSDGDRPVKKRGRKKKAAENIATSKSPNSLTNGTKRKKSISSSQVSTASSSSSSSTITNGRISTPTCKATKIKRGIKGNSKTSPKLRPRRRASQTYFFKYQLARNPLKAEEEDLKLALLASLQQDDGELSKQHLLQLKRQQLIYEHHLSNNSNSSSISSSNNNNNKQPKKGVQGINQTQSTKQNKQKQHPPNTTVAQHHKPTPPAYDEEYLKRYRPDTEEFLTFMCSRLHKTPEYDSSVAPQHITNELSTNIPTASGSIDSPHHNFINFKPSHECTPTTTGIHVKISIDKSSNEFHNLRRSTSPCKSSASNHTASNSSPNPLNSPSNRRRPTRHSPRLASTSRKISESDSLNHYTAYDSQITYEEEMNRASMALENIAQEMIGSDGSELDLSNMKVANGGTISNVTTTEVKSLSPYKTNKHLVRGLLTREFAGAFADEDIILESIKNHKL